MTLHTNYAIRTLKERLDYIENRSKPEARSKRDQHVAELRAAIKLIEKYQRLS